MAAQKQTAKPRKPSTQAAKVAKPSTVARKAVASKLTAVANAARSQPEAKAKAAKPSAAKPSAAKPSAAKTKTPKTRSTQATSRSAVSTTTVEKPLAKPVARTAAKGDKQTAAPKAQTPDVQPGAGPHDAAVRALREFGLRYPEAHTKSPWPGHLDLAVRDKTFAYLSLDGEPLRIGCKLPHSCQTALSLPFAQPTPYGLGKSGWVTATFEATDQPPLEFLEAWIDESYRAVAPKTLVKQLPPAR